MSTNTTVFIKLAETRTSAGEKVLFLSKQWCDIEILEEY